MEERLLVYNQDMPKPKIIHKDYSVCSYNQDMPKPKIIHKDYSVCSCNYQFRLPLELEVLIPNDDPVRLLNVFVEGMELTDLYQTYGKIKKSQASPRQLFKIVIYAAMNRIYSSRDIECSCRRDINFMYLLEGKPAPDHATIARFICVPKRPLLK